VRDARQDECRHRLGRRQRCPVRQRIATVSRPNSYSRRRETSRGRPSPGWSRKGSATSDGVAVLTPPEHGTRPGVHVGALARRAHPAGSPSRPGSCLRSKGGTPADCSFGVDHRASGGKIVSPLSACPVTQQPVAAATSRPARRGEGPGFRRRGDALWVPTEFDPTVGANSASCHRDGRRDQSHLPNAVHRSVRVGRRLSAVAGRWPARHVPHQDRLPTYQGPAPAAAGGAALQLRTVPYLR
jgi:hypothetical protein